MIDLRLVVVGLAILGLLGAPGSVSHADERTHVASVDKPAGPLPAGIKSRIKRYYGDHAGERDGLCRRPYIDAITRIDLVDDTSTGLVVDVRYAFRDRIRDDDDGRRCAGFESRRFTLRSGDGGVISMSGAPCKGLLISLDRALGLGDDRQRLCQ